MLFQKMGVAATFLVALGAQLAAQDKIVATLNAPERSEALKASKDPEFVLRNFKTMSIVTRHVKSFSVNDLTAALERTAGFKDLGITIVDDPHLADVVLDVSYTFAWDYPFQLRHQNTTMVLLAGTGYGPFSGQLGATSVAWEFVRLAKRGRKAPANP